jgi:hypothetical protein
MRTTQKGQENPAIAFFSMDGRRHALMCDEYGNGLTYQHMSVSAVYNKLPVVLYTS